MPLSSPVSGNISRENSLAYWLEYIETLYARTIDMSLDRIAVVRDRMGLNHPNFVLVTIAGTNGKGSTVAYLESILLAAGYRVGAYTSPHVVYYNERIKLNGQPISDCDLCEAFKEVEASRGGTPLTYFEYGTLVAMCCFAKMGIEVALMEVGMGGRLDAVNAWDAKVGIITTVDIDHAHWLGNSREAIAEEKAGIMRTGCPVICSDPNPPLAITQIASKVGAELWQLGNDFHYDCLPQGWNWRGNGELRSSLLYPSLRGAYQLNNAAGALMALSLLKELFPVTQAHIRLGLANTKLSGRFQVLPGRPTRVFDVAHNPLATKELARTLRQQPISGRTHAVVGALKDKPIREMFRPLLDIVTTWHFCNLDIKRGAKASDLTEALKAESPEAVCTAYNTALEAYHAALSGASEDDRLVIFGSFYTVGDIIAVVT